MRKLIIGISLVLAGCGPETTEQKKTDAKAEKVVIPSSVETRKGAAHVNIPGTHLFMVPDKHFKLSTQFTGFSFDDFTGINVMELVGGNFFSNAATFNRESFESKGAKVYEFKELKINSSPAKYIDMSDQRGGRIIDFVFGDSTYSVMVMAMCRENDSLSAERIKQMMLSIYYDRTLKVDPLMNANFEVLDTSSEFRFLRAGGPSYIFSIGGKQDDRPGAPTVAITSFPADTTINPKDLSNQMLGSLSKYGANVTKTESVNQKPINGYAACETEVDILTKNGPGKLYQVTLVDKNRALVLQGMSAISFETYLPSFKKFAHSIRFK
jgi:hypothetical protein